MGQFTPTVEGQPSRLRTGFERVVAHRTRLPFAYPAEQNGRIVDINEPLGVVKIKYKDGVEYVLQYGQQYTNNGGGGFHVTQNVVVNGYAKGDTFKRGDILLYNSDYFTADPYSKQVDMNLGHHANIALVEVAGTLDDACVLSRSLSAPLTSLPVQVRTISLTRNTTIHKIVTEGTKVKSTDPLMIFDESGIPDKYEANPELYDALKRLSNSIPKAKYTGTVVKVEAFYKSPISEMSESVQKVVRATSRKKNATAKLASGTANEYEHLASTPIAGDRMGTMPIDEETVILKIYIRQELSMETGDKIVFGGALKSVCSEVVDDDFYTESGDTVVQGLMGASSYANRMVPSILLNGAMNGILEKMETDILDLYFDE